nr:hypothetical protein [Deltaproteobacteria bacterium]
AMASCETDDDARDAKALGYRVFRVTSPDHPAPRGYASCPGSAEQGRRLTCLECGACSGGGPSEGPDIQTMVHGTRARHALPLLAT